MYALKFVMWCGELFYALVDGAADFFCHVARFCRLFGSIVARLPLLFKNVVISVEQMYAIGVESLPLVTVIAVFTGATTVTQAVYQFSGFVPMKYLGTAVCKTLVTEIGPVFTSMVIAGRISTAIAAEIGSMKVGEQLDAMSCLNLDSVRYLFAPKTVACVVMVPVLVVFAELVAFVSSIFTVLFSVKVTLYVYLTGLRLFFNPSSMLIGVAKTAVFGAIIAMTGCYFGLQTKGGAEGVGTSTTKAVMASCVLILVADFLIALLTL